MADATISCRHHGTGHLESRKGDYLVTYMACRAPEGRDGVGLACGTVPCFDCGSHASSHYWTGNQCERCASIAMDARAVRQSIAAENHALDREADRHAVALAERES